MDDKGKVEIYERTYNEFEYEYIDNAKQMDIYLEDYSFRIFYDTENAYSKKAPQSSLTTTLRDLIYNSTFAEFGTYRCFTRDRTRLSSHRLHPRNP